MKHPFFNDFVREYIDDLSIREIEDMRVAIPLYKAKKDKFPTELVLIGFEPLRDMRGSHGAVSRAATEYFIDHLYKDASVNTKYALSLSNMNETQRKRTAVRKPVRHTYIKYTRKHLEELLAIPSERLLDDSLTVTQRINYGAFYSLLAEAGMLLIGNRCATFASTYKRHFPVLHANTIVKTIPWPKPSKEELERAKKRRAVPSTAMGWGYYS